MSGTNLESLAEDLVERARLGDQLAAASIYVVGDLVRKNEASTRTKEAYAAISSYLVAHPVTGRLGKIGRDAKLLLRSLFAGEAASPLTSPENCATVCAALPYSGGPRALECATAILAPQIAGDTRVRVGRAFFGLDAAGISRSASSLGDSITKAAEGLARFVAGAPASAWNVLVGWELGE